MPRWLALFALCTLLLAPALPAQDLGFGGDDGDDIQLEETLANDFELLRHTYFTEFSRWPRVAPDAVRFREKGADYAWEADVAANYGGRTFVKPLGDQPLTNTIAVPEAGRYRVWLAYLGETRRPHPATLTLTGATAATLTFGDKPIPDRPLKELARTTPFRFESEVEAVAAQTRPTLVWEYRELELAAGNCLAALTSADRTARVEALVITRSRSFVPSKSPVEGEGNLVQTWYRWRLVEAPEGIAAVGIKSFVHYMWAHYRKNNPLNDIWYSSMGDIRPVSGTALPVGEWSAWNNCTEQTTNQGRYFADRLTVTDAKSQKELQSGVIEVQLAWYPHDGGILRTISNPIANGWTRYLVPVGLPAGYRPAVGETAEEAVWGARHPAYVAQLQSERQALEALLADIEALNLPAGQMPKRLTINTSCATSASGFDVAIPLLKKIGVNAIRGIPIELIRKYELSLVDQFYEQSGTIHVHSHDPLDPIYERELIARNYGPQALAKQIAEDPDYLSRPHWLKMGDEIGPVLSPAHIQGLPDVRAMFIEYLRQAAGGDPAFFGVSDFAVLPYDVTDRLDRSAAQRRLFYHSKQFTWYLTAEFYKRHTRAAQTYMPNILTRCNYTPGSLMFSGDMDGCHWFALPRMGASTAHSAEDWLSSGKGYTSQAGVQTESYYGAVVECGGRPGNLPLDFIMVGGSGALDRKYPLLVASRIHQIYLYDWGPQFTRGAVDTFSHNMAVYPQMNYASRVVGPAEDYLLDGQRQPSPVALLYNLTSETWISGRYGVFSDRLYTYLALRHRHQRVDVVLEEDLTLERLAPYRVLYLNGLNIRREVVPVLRQWVEAGGTLVATAGSLLADQYDEPLPGAAELLGATQRLAGVSRGQSFMPTYLVEHDPIDRLTVQESPVTPAVTADVIGLKCVLTPTTGKPIASYADGTCAGVWQELGKGRVLFLGIMPGLLYAQNAPRDDEGRPTTFKADRRELATAAAVRFLPPPPVEYSSPLVEVIRFDHPEAIAVVAVDFTYRAGTPGTLTVRTDRQIKDVSGTIAGKLTFRREGDAILVDFPTPNPSDVVILR